MAVIRNPELEAEAVQKCQERIDALKNGTYQPKGMQPDISSLGDTKAQIAYCTDMIDQIKKAGIPYDDGK